MSIERILNAVDFSPASRKSLEVAAELAAALNAQLEVITAVEVLTYRGVEYREVMSTQSWEEEFAIAQEKVDEWAAIASKGGASASGKALRGDARTAILEYAKESGAQLVVIGAKGHSRIHDLLLGSVATEVARSAACSVQLVR